VARVLKTSIALLLLGAVAVGVFVVVRDRVGRSAAETTPSTPGSPDGVGTTSSPVSTQVSTPAGPATVTTLPSTSYLMPAFRSAAVSESYSELDFADDGSVVAQTFGSDLLLDLVLDAASLTFTVDPPSGEAQPDGRYYGFLDRSYIYSSGTTFGAPWTRAPIKAETAALWLVPSRVHLAQEVFTPEVIADARNVSATEETVAGVPVTTYRFDLDLRVWFALAGPDAASQMSAASMDVFDVLDEEIRLVAPVFVGDTLYAESEVLEKRLSRSRPTLGVVTCATRGRKADGTVFLTCRRTFLLPTREHPADEDY